jgi:hypothetical protein
LRAGFQLVVRRTSTPSAPCLANEVIEMMLRVSLVIGTLFPLALAAQMPQPRLTPAEFWQDRRAADSLAGIGNAQAAEPLYRALALADTADVQLWLGLANAEMALRRLPAAESAFARVYEGQYFPSNVAIQIARIEAGLGQKGAALNWLDSALVHRWSSRASFQKDSAFASYHGDPRFRAIAGMVPDRVLSRTDGWRYDLAFFASEARRVHTGFDRPAFSSSFTEAVTDLDRRIPSLSDDQILAGLQHLAMLLHDGHSGVYLRNLPKTHRRLPVDFYWFADGMYIVDARQDHRDLVGSRVVRIGRLTPPQLVTALDAFVPHDNPMRILSLGVSFQSEYPFQLQALGAIDDTARVPIVVEDGSGRARELALVADDSRIPQARLAPRDTGVANPLWLRNTAVNIWMTPLADERAIYVQYNACADAPTLTIAAFAGRLRTALKDSTIRDLIIDVRRNGGGNSFLNLPLHQAIFEFEAASPAHRIWILAGRHTFSAAQNFVNYVERFTNAIFVGEPTGSSPNFTGENGEVVLPFSGVVAEISNANHWSAFWEDQRPWIAPTIPVALTAADYFSNRDPVLDAVRDIIRPGR